MHTTGTILVAFGGSCNVLGDNFNLNEGIMILLDAISIFHFPKNHLEFIQDPFDPTLKVYIDGQQTFDIGTKENPCLIANLYRKILWNSALFLLYPLIYVIT